MKKKDTAGKEPELLFTAADKEVTLPEGLSEENIVALVADKKQKADKRKVVRRTVFGVLAACLALFCVTAYDYAVFRPAKFTTPKDGGLVYAETEEDIIGLVNDYVKYRKADDVLDLVRDFRFRKKYYDSIAVEEMAMDTGYGAFENGAVMMPAEAPEAVSEAVLYNAAFDGTEDAIAGTAAEPDESRLKTQTTSDTADAAPAHSETNTRVEGIAEADIIKTDGRFLYTVSYSDTVHIFKPEQDDSVTELAVLRPDADLEKDIYIRDIYIAGDLLIVNVNCYFFGDDEYHDTCGAMIYDITDRSAPVLVRTVLQDGNYLSGRIVNGSLIMVSQYGINCWPDHPLGKEEVIPGTYNGVGAEKEYIPAENIAILNAAEPESYIVLQKFPLSDLNASPETVAMFGSGSETYCTASTLYITSTRYGGFSDTITVFGGWNSFSSATTVLSFDITGDTPVFKAKGEFEGQVLNSFSLDESNGYLRVAATRDSDNVLYVLDGSLNKVSELGGFGENEQIRSVRFMGNTAYVVTFRQTDPLFVIDLTDPAAPVMKGQLFLPGFSSYLHPAGNGYLIGIGVDGTETGINNNAKISLFDVSDPTAPKETDSLVIENAWFDTDYKAFGTISEDGSFLIPVNISSEKQFIDDGKVYIAYNEQVGAVRVKAENGKLSLINGYYFDNPMSYTVPRACYIGNRIYLVSQVPMIAVFDMETASSLFFGSFAPEQNGYEDPLYPLYYEVTEGFSYTEGYTPETMPATLPAEEVGTETPATEAFSEGYSPETLTETVVVE